MSACSTQNWILHWKSPEYDYLKSVVFINKDTAKAVFAEKAEAGENPTLSLRVTTITEQHVEGKRRATLEGK